MPYQDNDIIEKQKKLVEQASFMRENKIERVIPQPKRDIEWETMRITFELSKKDIMHIEDIEGLRNSLEEKKDTRDLSSYIKKLILNDYEKSNLIEDGTDKMIEMFLKKLNETGLTLVEKEVKNDKDDMDNILSNQRLKNKLLNIDK